MARLDDMNMEMPQNFEPEIEVPPINIDTALRLIKNLEDKLKNQATLERADKEEIIYIVESLQILQNDGFNEPEISEALTRIIYLRDELKTN